MCRCSASDRIAVEKLQELREKYRRYLAAAETSCSATKLDKELLDQLIQPAGIEKNFSSGLDTTQKNTVPASHTPARGRLTFNGALPWPPGEPLKLGRGREKCLRHPGSMACARHCEHRASMINPEFTSFIKLRAQA